MKLSHILTTALLVGSHALAQTGGTGTGTASQTTSSSSTDDPEGGTTASRNVEDGESQEDQAEVITESDTPEPPPLMGGYGADVPAGYGDGYADGPMQALPPPYDDAMAPEPATYTKYFDDWQPCTNDRGRPVKCGGGTQRRGYECKSSGGARKSKQRNCQEPEDGQLEQQCAQQPCEAYEWKTYGESACSAECGAGYRRTKAKCVSSTTQRPVAPENCDPTLRPTEWQPCESACNQPYYTYTPWSPCDKPCGGGESRRTATCHDTDRTEADRYTCAAAGVEPKEVTRQCNKDPCAVWVWKAGPWGACDSECGGMKTREVTCRNVKAKKDAQGGADVSADGSECEGQDKPPTEAPCKPCTSFCDNQDCSGHGTCSGEVCMCADGWGGPYCGIDTSECASGKLDVNEECCPSGVLDDDGICCSAPEGVTPERDWNGQCCPGTVDACGRCNGDTACIGLDVEGTCCEATDMMGIQNVCCQAPSTVDICGVCGGTGSCTTTTAMLIVSDPLRRRSLLADTEAHVVASVKAIVVAQLGYPEAKVMVTATRTADSSGWDVRSHAESVQAVDILLDPTSLSDDERAALTITDTDDANGALFVAIGASPDLGDVASMTVTPNPDCGDAECQIGEPVDANETLPEGEACRLEDCPVRIGFCPAPGGSEVGNTEEPCGGNGRCDLASLTCVCAVGYIGDACEACGDGYVRVAGPYDACERDVSAQLASGGADAPGGAGAVAPEAADGDEETEERSPVVLDVPSRDVRPITVECCAPGVVALALWRCSTQPLLQLGSWVHSPLESCTWMCPCSDMCASDAVDFSRSGSGMQDESAATHIRASAIGAAAVAVLIATAAAA